MILLAFVLALATARVSKRQWAYWTNEVAQEFADEFDDEIDTENDFEMFRDCRFEEVPQRVFNSFARQTYQGMKQIERGMKYDESDRQFKRHMLKALSNIYGSYFKLFKYFLNNCNSGAEEFTGPFRFFYYIFRYAHRNPKRFEKNFGEDIFNQLDEDSELSYFEEVYEYYADEDANNFFDYVWDYLIGEPIESLETTPPLLLKYEKWQLRKYGNILDNMIDS